MTIGRRSYHQRIIDYYRDTENAYRDSWDLDNSLAIHYGYWDEKVRSFPQSLLRMNEIMADEAEITDSDKVLDAGCGVGGSGIFIAKERGATVLGITLSDRQVSQARLNASRANVDDKASFEVLDYNDTGLPGSGFDVVWGCESICYSENKETFIKEAYRLLKPGGRLVIADGFVTRFENNEHPVIRQWLDGWQVNYLESPERMKEFMSNEGFGKINYRNISRQTAHSSRRLYLVYYLANLYLAWKKLTFASNATNMQKANIKACRFQYIGLKKGLWQYGLLSGHKK